MLYYIVTLLILIAIIYSVCHRIAGFSLPTINIPDPTQEMQQMIDTLKSTALYGVPVLGALFTLVILMRVG